MIVRHLDTDEPDAEVDAEFAAAHLASICNKPITPATIRKWASRGKVHRTGSCGRAATYSMNALQEYADSLYGTA